MYFLMVMTMMMKMTKTMVGTVNDMTAGFWENNVRVEHSMLPPNSDSVIQRILCSTAPTFLLKVSNLKKSLDVTLKWGAEVFCDRLQHPLNYWIICNFSFNDKGGQTKVPKIENVIFRSSEYTSEKGL